MRGRCMFRGSMSRRDLTLRSLMPRTSLFLPSFTLLPTFPPSLRLTFHSCPLRRQGSRYESVLIIRFYYFLRPFFSLLAIFISQVSVFYHAHAKDSWLQFTVAAVQALVFGIWDVVMREQSHVRGNAGKWRDAKGEELKK
jgi:hypothetical protein